MQTFLTIAPAVLAAMAGTPELTPTDMTSEEAPKRIYVETEEVEDGTECLVAPETVPALKSMGYEIKQKENGDYYYNSSPTAPKIASITLVEDDLDELFDRVGQLENAAIGYQTGTLNTNPASMNNLVLGYIRGFNPAYVGDVDDASDDHETLMGLAWWALAGSSDIVFDTFCNWGGQEQYWARYMTPGTINTSRHNVSSQYLQGMKFEDPATGRPFDLIHMFASLDGAYDLTNSYCHPAESFGLTGILGSVSAFLNSTVLKPYAADLVSWAGDLHSAAAKISESELPFTFETILNEQKYQCTWEDMIADMDAINIANFHLTGVGRTSDALKEYYNASFSNSIRRSKFIDSVLADKNENWAGTKNEQFRLEVYDAMGLTKNGPGWKNNDKVNDPIMKNLYRLMMDENGNLPSVAVRERVAKTFCDYVFSMC